MAKLSKTMTVEQFHNGYWYATERTQVLDISKTFEAWQNLKSSTR